MILSPDILSSTVTVFEFLQIFVLGIVVVIVIVVVKDVFKWWRR